ncbi:MAG: ATP synthase F1 subunit epsilon [Deltaproteobacteria bacterium]|nr:MAG: ATP synthase F1 subunit epsilon [Deltaproteobacteria bacterium]
MGQQIRLEIVTPTGSKVDEDVDIVNAPGVGGDFGILANHAPFLSAVKVGVLSYETGSERVDMMISGGFCEVSANKVTFLVESAERGSEIDVDRAMAAKDRAERRLAGEGKKLENFNQSRAELALQRSLARLKVAKKV